MKISKIRLWLPGVSWTLAIDTHLKDLYDMYVERVSDLGIDTIVTGPD